MQQKQLLQLGIGLVAAVAGVATYFGLAALGGNDEVRQGHAVARSCDDGATCEPGEAETGIADSQAVDSTSAELSPDSTDTDGSDPADGNGGSAGGDSQPTTTSSSRTTSTSTTSSAITSSTITTSTTTTSSSGEANLTMTQPVAVVRDDGTFKIDFSTNLCTIANYSGANQSYITPGWPEVTGACWQDHGQNFTAPSPGSYTILVRARTRAGQEATRTVAVTVNATTTSPPGEANLTMSQPAVAVNADSSFKVTFSTNLCTIANYSGAGQSYVTPGWPDVTGSCWESHGQNFSTVEPGSYTISVRARSRGGQEASRSVTVVIG